MSSPPDDDSLRERKKRELRAQLREIAQRMFAERGFDAVTVAEIAHAAGVSDKTVFNYFPAKEDLVLDGHEELEADFVQSIRLRRPGESVLAAARRHALAVAAHMNELPADRRTAFRKIIAATPALRARMHQIAARREDELARVLAAELDDISPLTLHAVAAAIGMLTRLGFGVGEDRKRWSYSDLVADIDATFDLFERGLGDFGVRTRRK